MKTSSLLALGLVGTLALTGCDQDGHDHDEGELVTRIVYTLTPTTGGAAVTASFNDANRNGLVDTGETTAATLVAGRTYTGTVAVFDTNGEITSEIVSENDEHAFVYTPQGGAASRLTVTSTDADAGGLPFRRTTTATVSAGAAATGTLLVELVHFGSAAAKRTANGIPTAAMERDVSVALPIIISVAP